ncbi:protein argonaute-4-like [Amblyomma americanum]
MNTFSRHGGLFLDENNISEHLSVKAAGNIEGFVDLGDYTSSDHKEVVGTSRAGAGANVTAFITRGGGTAGNGARIVAPTESSPTRSPSTTAAPMRAGNCVGNTDSQNDELKIQEIERTLPSHFPRRPAEGKVGRPIQLTGNHFNIEIPSGNVFHYDVEICSETRNEARVPEKRKYRCISTKINRLVIELLAKKYRVDLNGCMPAFDGRKNLYTRRELKFRERSLTVDFEEDQRNQKFIVKIQYAAAVNLDALLAVFDKRVSHVPHEVLQAMDIVLRHGPSIKPTPVGRSFFKPPSPNDYNILGGGREAWFGYYTSVRPAQWKPMLNVDMSATDFYEPLPVTDFMCELFIEGRREMSARDFKELRDFQNVRLNKELKGLRVKVTHLPYPRKYKVVLVTKEPAKQLFFDMEDGSCCSVADYFQNRYHRLRYPNLPCIQTGNAARPVYLPLEVCVIVEGQHCKKKLDENQTSEMIKHTPQPPAKRFNEIRQSVWDLPATLSRWTLLNLSRFAQRDSLDNFVKMLIRVGQELGMRIEQPLDVTTTDANRKPVRNILPEEQRRTASLEMVISVLAKNTNYAEIKQKINVKLDGINNSLLPKEMPKMFQKPVIIIGADMDDSASTSRLEVIKDLKVMMKDMLKAFYHATKHKPERIIFFRD